ncbi:phosphotransferase [Oceanobacillus halotolerans]|uniref:phosphotransferase n=1 Tax=Oceanobacillus halotolerans TaxID=2663380 RepID=UPI0013DCC6EC|nr:phosphotransferase [Oceanobacillus halotolerans]
MNRNKQRDDNYFYRLYSFLYKEGNLELKHVQTIKKNVFLIEDRDNKKLILKKYQKGDIVKQQWEFFKQIHDRGIISFLPFPNGKEMIHDKHAYWTIAPYINGESISYRNEADRIEALHRLRLFHQKATSVYIDHPIKRDPFYVRWSQRLMRFKKTRYIFEKWGYENLYHDIVQTTAIYLRLVAKFPWDQDIDHAIRNGIWVHGDVASHNFLKYREKVYLIDFDLLALNPQIYDYIQLGQRFLPHVNWNVDKLLTYKMVPESETRRWLLTLFIPSDMFREWLHFLSRNYPNNIQHYLQSLEKQWIKRKRFLEEINLMLK